ncbi:MAG TPA: SGNH/GDSL hydrolase family protein, partial [Myxococcota bacterium]|nr:SGNH/GDSL hydrolase family protein [Myxococcota bacterium]
MTPRAVAGAVVQLALGVALAEGMLRAAMLSRALREELTHNFGPASSRMGWFYYHLVLDVDPMLQRDPDLGWVNRPGVRDEGGATITTNAQGFRATAPVPDRAPDGQRRVIVIGDSFTFGTDGDDAWIYPVQLAGLRPDLDVVDLGVPGYGLDQALLRYRRDARPLHPDHVVVCVHELLIARPMSDFFLYAKPIIRAEDGSYEPEGLPLPDEATLWRQVTWTPHLWYAVEMAQWARWSRTRGFEAQRRARAEGLMHQIAVEARADGVDPTLAWCETPWQVMEGRPSAWLHAACPAEARCVDTTPALAAEWAAG